MRCPQCDSDNKTGSVFCTTCGAKLDLTAEQAHTQATQDVSHAAWKKTYQSLNRGLFLAVLGFIAAVLFSAYAHRDIVADFTPTTPLPAPPPLALTSSFVQQPELPVPTVEPAPPIQPDNADAAALLSDLSATVRDRLRCEVFRRTGGIVRGILLEQTDDTIKVINEKNWKVIAIPMSEIDLGQSTLPE